MTYKEQMDAEFKRGIEKGIEIFIEDKLEDGVLDEIIIDKVKNKFNVSGEAASEYLERCKERLFAGK